MNGINKLPALIKREILEHKNLWKVPLILIGIAVLVKVSLAFGNLSINFDLPDQLQLDDDVDSAINVVVAQALNSMNYIIMMVMFVVSISIRCLACLMSGKMRVYCFGDLCLSRMALPLPQNC